MIEFQGFSKIPRLFRDIVITEKIDGTNAQITVINLQQMADENNISVGHWMDKVNLYQYPYMAVGQEYALLAGSRKRYISMDNDNHGFGKWVSDKREELVKLGHGKHFGEWWGQGIQRGYGLKEKRFSLFNTAKWSDDAVRPACCHVVPVLYTDIFDTEIVHHTLWRLKQVGSLAAPGFMKPEGIVVFHTAGNLLFKATIENDDKPKGQVQ